MNKNKKILFLALALVTVLILISAVNATNTTDKSIDNTISEKTSTPTSKLVKEETPTKEKIETQTNKEIKKTNKTKVKKDNENIKTFNVTSGTEVVNKIASLSTDTECNYYILNCTRDIVIGGKTYLADLSMDKTVQIEGNGRTLSGNSYLYTGTGNYIINNITTTKLVHYNSNTIINNSFLNAITYNDGIYPLHIINTQITKKVQQYNDTSGSIIFENCYINAEIRQTNNDIIFDDYCTFGPNTILKGNFIINDISKIYPYIDGYKGNNTIENQIISTTVNNYGNLLINQSTLTDILHNYENATIINSTLSYQSTTKTGLYNHHNCEIENTTINSPLTNYDNITINNLQITQPDDTINELQDYVMITNYGTMNLNGNITSTFKCILINNGNITINENTKLNNITISEGNTIEKTIENTNITQDITILDQNNATIINCNISAKFTNNGKITLINCSLSNNDIVSTSNDGKLLHNLGNATLINCSIMNNTLTTSYDGSLLYNLGDMNLTNCVVNNNTFNITSYSAQINGIVVNMNHMTITDSLFSNNTDLSDAYTRGSTIYNNGTLNIDNSNFTYNIAGKNGGSITSTNKLLNVNNSIFIGNKASSLGGAINGAGNITNSIFTRNYLEKSGEQQIGGGAVAGAENIINCTFDSNNVTCVAGILGVVAHGGAVYNTANVIDSTFINNTAQNGAAIATRKLSSTSELNMYTIMNCLFENNTNKNIGSIGSIIYDSGYLYMKNNTFINNTDADYLLENPLGQSGYGGQTSAHKMNETISNNTFKDNKLDTDLFMILEPEYITATDNIYSNNTFNDTLTLNIPEKIYAGEAITITGTYTINQASFYDTNILEQNQYNVYINGVLNQTLDEIEFTLTPTTGNMIVTVQPTISQTRKTSSLRSLTNVIITPENYNEYIYEGNLLGISPNSKITFQGTFTDKDEIEIDIEGVTLDGTDAQFTNTYITIEASKVTIANMKINNTDIEYTITNTKDENQIINNTITVKNTVGKTAAIYNQASNTLIKDNTLFVDGPAGDIDHEHGGICTTQAILLIGGDKNNITQNIIKATSTITSQSFGTIEGITNSKKATNTFISKNDIQVDGGRFNYAINSLYNVENMTIQENNIQTNGERYACGIQVGDGAKNIQILNNNITCVCQNTTPVDEEALSYGIVTINSNKGYADPDTINIQANNIKLTGTVNYGMEIYHTTNTVISGNNITANGAKSMGIGFAHSPNSYVVANNITTTGDNNQQLNGVTEEIRPANVGLQIQQESNNIQVWYNNIQTYDKAGQDACVNVDSNSVYVMFNNLTSSKKVGNEAVNGKPDTNIQNNNAIEQESTTTTEDEIVLGESTTLTASFYDDEYVPISEGKAIFRINGKTLRDDQGNVIYADVIYGRAELPDVNITSEWTKEGTTIQAVYCGDSENAPIMAEESVISVTQPEATITIEAPEQATAGQTITLTARVSDGEKAVNSGRVAFKLNGKTLKDKDGKALYANVENGVATVTYTIPEKTKAKTYTLTAVFTDTLYDRQEAETELIIAKA